MPFLLGEFMREWHNEMALFQHVRKEAVKMWTFSESCKMFSFMGEPGILFQSQVDIKLQNITITCAQQLVHPPPDNYGPLP